jgi:hypothetical protein
MVSVPIDEWWLVWNNWWYASSVPLCPPKIPHDLTWARSWRLTPWATARPYWDLQFSLDPHNLLTIDNLLQGWYRSNLTVSKYLYIHCWAITFCACNLNCSFFTSTELMATEPETYACNPAFSLAVFCVVMKREMVRCMLLAHFVPQNLFVYNSIYAQFIIEI